MTPRSSLLSFLRLCSNVRWKLHSPNLNGTHFRKRPPHQLKCYSTWSSRNKSTHSFPHGFISIGVLGISSVIFYKFKDSFLCYAEQKKPDEELHPGKFREGLPTYSLEEVEKHKTKEDRIWVTYRRGVYDVTQFVDEHPGGKKILLAAGSSVEPFWMLYAVHHTPEVYNMLEALRIGNLDEEDESSPEVNATDPYATDPKRHPALIPASRKPFNAEPPKSLLVDEFVTPNEIFYVRNHLPVPVVNPKEYRLEVEGLGVRKKKFTLEDIKKFPKHTITAAVQCAGNRRSEMTAVKPVKGLNWNQAAIGNATWTGARLTDVLKACGFSQHPELKHFQFEGLDKGPDELPYGASVPAHKILDPTREVLLAYEMNGKEISRDHGYPLRLIVPGVVGARNVKWVTKIILSESESESFWQQYDYKGFCPSTNWDTVDFSQSPAIQDLPVNSAICVPEAGDKVEVVDGCILVKGYAWAGGGNPIARVDVSTNRGKTWHIAEMMKAHDEKSDRWAWTLWTILVPVDTSKDEAEIWVKAVDASYNTQPESFENIWNLRGLLSNAYHRVRVRLEKS